MKRLRHALAHLLGLYDGEVVTWLLNDELIVGFRCSACGRVGGAGKAYAGRK